MVDFSKYVKKIVPEEPVDPQPVDLAATVNQVNPEDEPQDFSKFVEGPDVPLDKTVYHNVARTSTPAGEAEMQQIEAKTGIPQDVIRANMGASRTRAEYSTLVLDAQGSPKLLGFLQDPKQLAAVREDVPALSQVEATLAHDIKTNIIETFEDIPAGFKRGQEVVEAGQLYSELSNLIATGGDQTEVLERIAVFEEKEKAVASEGGFLEAAAEMLPIMGHTILAGQAEGLKYATVGATGSLITGGVTAPAAAAIMYPAGVVVGAMEQMFSIERGNALKEFMDLKDETGAPMDPQVANMAAIGVGAINAGLEYVGLKNIPGADKLLGKFTKDAVKKALKDPSVRRALTKVALRYGKGIAVETITEASQEIINILGGAIAKKVSDQEFAPEGILSLENLSRVLEAGEMAFKATTVLGAPGSGISAVREVRKTEKMIQDQQAFVEHHAAVDEAVQATDTALSNPVMMERFLKDTMGLKDQDAFIDSDVLLELEQNTPEILDEIIQEMGASKDKILEAAEQGRPVRLNMGAYHARLSPEAKTALFNGLKSTPGSYSAAQIEAGMAQAADNFEDNFEGFIIDNEALNTEIIRIESESLAAGADSRVAAQTAQIAARMAISVAENTVDGNAAELLRKIQFGPMSDPAVEAKVFSQEASAVSFEAWSKGAPVVEGFDIKEDTASGAKVFKVFHGTTHAFNVFDPTITGNKEGAFGAVNYFTSDKGDADLNYAGVGPDLTQRIELRTEQIESDLYDRDWDGIKEDYNLPDQFTEKSDDSDIAEFIARRELEGGSPETLSLFVRLDNPAYVGGDTTTWIDNDVTEQYREDATAEVLDENDATSAQVDEYEGEIRERMEEYAMYDEPPVSEAIRTTIASFETDVLADTVLADLGDLMYEDMAATDLEKALKESEDLLNAIDYDSGDLIGPHIIGQVFKNLGFDGIVMQDADKRFPNMDMGGGTAHVHVFEETPSQVKDRSNITFDPNNPDIYQQIDKINAELAGGLGISDDGITTFDPVKAALGASKTFYQGISTPGQGGRFLRGAAGSRVNLATFSSFMENQDLNEFDQVKTVEEAQQLAEAMTWLTPKVVTSVEEIDQAPGFNKKSGSKLMRWGLKKAKGYDELGKAFYGNDKMAFPNAIYPHGRNTWDIPGCGREAWANVNGIDITQACYGGACYAEAITKAKQGLAASVATGVRVAPLRGRAQQDIDLRKAMNAFHEKKGLEATQLNWPEFQIKVNTTKGSKNFGKLSIGVVSSPNPAAVVSTKLQAAKGADIRLGVDTDGGAWLSDPRVMDAIMKADPRTLTVYSSAYHQPPPAHALSGRTIINVTVSGWHPLPETMQRIRWAEAARANGWNVILREVVADEVTFDKATSSQYNRIHSALLATDFFVMLQPLHLGTIHGTTIDNMPGCCVGTEKNQHTCDQCEVAEGLGKGFQEYWEIHEERDPANSTGEIVLPDSDYEGRTLYQGAKGNVQIFDDRYLINLFENANESTPFHELAHTFLFEMQTVVDKGAASDQMVADMKVVGSWMDTLDEPDLFQEQFEKYTPNQFAGRLLGSLTDLERAQAADIMKHEYFARGFEQYLMEGKAPAPELIPAFRRFARWLKVVYKHVSQLDVKLTAPIRGVFSRMLQSEFEIEGSMNGMGLQALTKKEMDALGVLPEDRDYLKRLHQDAQTAAEVKLTAARVGGVRRLRPEWIEKADDSIQRDPLNATVNRLKKGQGIDRKVAVELWTKAAIDRMPVGLKKIFKVGGMNPDEVAYEEGYASAENLLDALETWVTESMQKRRYVAQRQKEYQDSLNPDDFLVDTAEFAEYLGIIGNYTAGKMGDQAQLDIKLQGTKGSKTVLARSAFKKYAKTIIRDMPIRDAVRSDLFTGAMKKASQGEAAAIKRGDWGTAQRANEQMRLNFEMAQESRRIKLEKEKTERMAKRLKKAKPDKVEASYLGAALSLAQRFGLVQLNDAFIPILQKAGDIKSLMTDKADIMGPDEFGFSTELMSGVLPLDYRDLNADELNEVAVLIKALVKRGRDKINPKLTSLGITLDEAKENVLPAIGSLKSKTKWAKRGKSFFGMDPRAWLRSITDFSRRIYADTYHLWAMIRVLDGFVYYDKGNKRGPLETYMRDNLEKAYGTKTTLTAKFEPKVKAAIAKLYNRAGNRKKMAVWLTDIIPVPVPRTLVNDGRGWDFEAVAAVALNIGNESNLSRLRDGYGWTDEQINSIVGLLTEKEWDAVQELWDIFEEMRPGMYAAAERIHGVEPPTIEHRAFRTPAGKVMRGGYAPAVYDFSSVRAAELNENQLLRQTADAGHQRPSVNARATKSRATTAGGMPIRLDLSGIAQQFDYNLHYTAFAETVRDLSRLLGDQEVADAIREKVGKEWLPAMRIILANVANPGVNGTTDTISNLFKWFGIQASKFVLGLNRGVGVKQVFSVPAIYTEGGSWFGGLPKVLTNPRKAYNDMLEESPLMKLRMDGSQIDREVSRMRRDLSKQNKLSAQAWEVVDEALFIFIRLFDGIAVLPGYYGTKKRMERKFGPGQRAIRETEKILTDTQPISRQMDMSRVQLNRTGLARLVTMFTGFTMKFENRNRVYVRGFLEGKISFRRFATQVVLERLMPPLLMNLLFTMGYGDEPDAEAMLWDAVLYQVCGFPILRELAVGVSNAVRHGYDGEFRGFSPIGTPLLAVGEAIYFNMNTVSRWLFGDATDKEGGMALLEGLLALKGVPAVKAYKDIEEGIRQMERSDGFDAFFKAAIKPNPKERE